MSNLDEKFLTFLTEILSTGNSRDLFNIVANLDLPEPYRFRVKILYSKIKPSKIFERIASKEIITRLSLDNCSYLYETSVGLKHKKQIKITFFLISFEHGEIGDNVQALVSICKREEWTSLGRFINSYYPHLVPIMLSQLELINSAKKLKELSAHTVKVKSFTAKEAVEGSSSKKSKSIREWTEEKLEQVIISVHDRQQIITSIDIEFYPVFGGKSHVIPSARCKIRKSGEIEVNANLIIPFNSVAIEIARVGQKKLQFYSNRGLRESSYKPHPFAIRLKRPVFKELYNVRSFVEILRKFPHSMHAVQHGNPYAHVKITDLYDYSSFDVWAVPPSDIAILPGLKTSEASFERMVSYIFDKFREGDVVEYE